jgi:hypothetical protein
MPSVTIKKKKKTAKKKNLFADDRSNRQRIYTGNRGHQTIKTAATNTTTRVQKQITCGLTVPFVFLGAAGSQNQQKIVFSCACCDN